MRCEYKTATKTTSSKGKKGYHLVFVFSSTENLAYSSLEARGLYGLHPLLPLLKWWTMRTFMIRSGTVVIYRP